MLQPGRKFLAPPVLELLEEHARCLVLPCGRRVHQRREAVFISRMGVGAQVEERPHASRDPITAALDESVLAVRRCRLNEIRRAKCRGLLGPKQPEGERLFSLRRGVANERVAALDLLRGLLPRENYLFGRGFVVVHEGELRWRHTRHDGARTAMHTFTVREWAGLGHDVIRPAKVLHELIATQICESHLHESTPRCLLQHPRRLVACGCCVPFRRVSLEGGIIF
eukprot:scaffold129847_cov66-Phaeocystis_antarctica.AAC.7